MTEPTSSSEAVLQDYIVGPARLSDAVAHLSSGQLDLAPSPGSWTVRQIAHHIVDGDYLWTVFIRAALGNTQPVLDLQWYWARPQDQWALDWHYAERSLETSLALFAANRLDVVDLVRRIPDAWSRSVWINWPRKERELVTAGEIFESQARHALGHIEEILSILKPG